MSNLNVALEQKERSALFVAQIAKSLGADAALVTEEGYGNPDADFTGCIVALEDAGVKTVGLTNECTGLTFNVKLPDRIHTRNITYRMDVQWIELFFWTGMGL